MYLLLGIALAGFLAQLIDGSLGMGYGVSSTTLLLTVGLTPALASASVHLAEIGTTAVSGAAHWRLGNVDMKIMALLAIPGGIGAFLGAVVLSNLSTEAARPWVSVVLLVLGAVIVLRFIRRDRESARENGRDCDAAKVRIDRVAHAGGAGCIRARHAAERNRPAIGHHQPIPYDEQALIAMRGSGVVSA